jgi:amidase
VLFDDALEVALSHDRYYHEHQEFVGPLHGVAVTLMDHADIKGVDTTLGCVEGAFSPASKDALLVTILKRCGAVIIAKTKFHRKTMGRTTPANSPFPNLQVC